MNNKNNRNKMSIKEFFKKYWAILLLIYVIYGLDYLVMMGMGK